jgi:hypothetical protein
MTHSTLPSSTDGEIVREDERTTPHGGFTEEQVRAVAAEIGLDLDRAAFDLDAFRRGMKVELEHGLRDPETDVTHDDPRITGKIAWAHLKEFSDYYERLQTMEREAEASASIGAPES